MQAGGIVGRSRTNASLLTIWPALTSGEVSQILDHGGAARATAAGAGPRPRGTPGGAMLRGPLLHASAALALLACAGTQNGESAEETQQVGADASPTHPEGGAGSGGGTAGTGAA